MGSARTTAPHHRPAQSSSSACWTGSLLKSIQVKGQRSVIFSTTGWGDEKIHDSPISCPTPVQLKHICITLYIQLKQYIASSYNTSVIKTQFACSYYFSHIHIKMFTLKRLHDFATKHSKHWYIHAGNEPKTYFTKLTATEQWVYR